MKNFGGLLILLGSFLILSLGLSGLIKALPISLIRRFGRPAVGTVSSTRTRTVGQAQPTGSSVRIFRTVQHTEARIRFTATGGRVVEFWTDLDLPYAPKPRGSSYELRYLARFPKIHRFTTPKRIWSDILIGLIGGGSILGVGILLVITSK